MKKKIILAVLAMACIAACKKGDPPSQTQTTNNSGGSTGGTTGGNNSGGSSNTNTLSISDFSPKSAKPTEIITITGQGFGTNTSLVQVAIGNSPYDHPVTVTPTSMTIQTNLATPSGKISVIVNGNKVTSTADFTALPEDLKIVSLQDGEGNGSSSERLGHQMYIYASGFGTDTNKIFISFGGTTPVKANYIGPNHFATGAVVPRYALAGKVTLTVDGKSVTSDDVFNLQMSLRDFTPKTFSSGDTVKITGVAFTTTTDMSVDFNNNAVTRPFKVTPTEMLVIVPSNAKPGYLTVSTYLGSLTDFIFDNAHKYTVVPVVYFNNVFTPASGKIGDIIRINGDFSGADITTLGISFGGSKPIQPTSITGPDIYVKTLPMRNLVISLSHGLVISLLRVHSLSQLCRKDYICDLL